MLIIICAILAASVFGGSVFIRSIQNGLHSYEKRLGADIIVIPEEVKEEGSFDGILLQGIPDTFYMDRSVLEKVKETEGVEIASYQFFLASANAGCCDSPVQIIGFDPETDFSIQPWIREAYEGEITDGDLIVGSNIVIPPNRQLRFYNVTLNVAAKLEKTGTGLDNAVFGNIETIKSLIRSADSLGFEDFKDVDPDSVISAVMVRNEKGYDVYKTAGNINIPIEGVNAVTSQKMIYGIAQGLKNVSGIIGIITGLVWVLSIIILIALFSLIAGERVRELAILRITGASKKIITGALLWEAFLIALIGSVSGIAAISIVYFPFADTIKRSLELPVLQPGAGFMILTGFITIILSIIICGVTWSLCVLRIAARDTGLLSKEGV